MVVPVRTRALTRSRRVALLRKDRQGVASTIGTIMALLVFLAFMSLIVNSYVPAWMLDNERSHMNKVMDQFGELKGKVDSMIAQERTTGDTSLNMYAPITVGSEGVPVFATPTAGLISRVPQGVGTTGINIQFSYATTTGDVAVDVSGGGKIELYAPNRYYVQQWIAYENGAIIIRQEDGQAMRAFPNLDISKNAGSINVGFTEVDIIGTNQSLTGSETVGFSLDLLYIDAQTYTVAGDGTWKLTMNTTYGAAWWRYFNDTLTAAGLVSGTDYVLTPTLPVVATDDVVQISLTLNNCGTVAYNRAYVSMTMLTS